MTKIASHSMFSPWQVNEWPEMETADSDQTCDICIIGAGIAGLTTAYLLSKEGRKVIVLEASAPGSGETGNSTAHLASALDDRFFKLEKIFGKDGAHLAAESHRLAIDGIESICQQEGISCGFERLDGYLFSSDPRTNSELQLEYDAAQRAGFLGLEMASYGPLSTLPLVSCIRFPQQAQFHPLLYLKGLAQAVVRQGGKILGPCEAHEIDDKEGLQVLTKQGIRIKAKSIVVATNSPFNNRFAMHTKQHAARTYVLGFEIDPGSIPKALYWDMEDPYHYARIQDVNAQQSLLIVGGEDHKTGQEDDPQACFTRLESWVRTVFPQAGAIAHSWSGQVLEPIDSLAFIGRNPGDKDIYIATGDSGNGLTHGTIAGLLLTDLIQGRKNPWEQIYDPSRLASSKEALMNFFKENLNVALQYKDYISPGEKTHASDIPLGEGAVVRQGLRKLALFRDHDNKLHSFSAICPHLGGVVRWNKSEKTWDCPCHGSRFSAKGEIVNGPAINNLTDA